MDDNGRDEGEHNSEVSRRTFVKAAGVSGVAVGLAGCLGGGDGGTDTPTEGADTPTEGDDGAGDTATSVAGTEGDMTTTNNATGTATGGEQVTLQFAASQEEAGVSEEFTQALYDAGMPQRIDVEFLAGSNVTDQRQSQYQTWLNAGRENPDLLRMDTGWTIPFIGRDQILNLSEELPQDVLDRVNNSYFDPMLNAATGANGDLFAVPLWVGIPTMLYRKDLVTDAGYDPDGNNWSTESITWQRFAEVTSTVKQENDLDYGFTFQADDYGGLACCDFNEFMSGWGGAYFGGRDNLFGPVGDRPVTVDEQQVIDSIRMIRTFIYGPEDDAALPDMPGNIAPQAVTEWTEGTSETPFADGNAAMHRNWPYAVNTYGAEGEFGEDLGVMPIPYSVTEEESQYDGIGGPVAAMGGQNLAVNPNSTNLDAAMEFVQAVTNQEFNLQIFELIGQIPPRPEVLQSDRASQIQVTGRYIDALRTAGNNLIPRPVTVAWPPESQQIATTVNAAYRQQMSPEGAMSDLQNTIEQIEQRFAQQAGGTAQAGDTTQADGTTQGGTTTQGTGMTGGTETTGGTGMTNGSTGTTDDTDTTQN